MSNPISRRTFHRLAGAAGALSALGLSGCGGGGGQVVVVGGGFGGATAAKYLKRYDPTLEVTLIEAGKTHFTCPFSNTVVGGMNPLSFIERNYNALANTYKVKVFTDTVTTIDTTSKVVKTASGKSFPYDRLVVAPGIDFKPHAIQGYDEAAAELMPHAWKAGPQTALLRRQLEAMANGGVVVVAPPVAPHRSPAGPYERVSLIASYLKKNKPKSKILVLDGKNSFSEDHLFKEGWDKLYEDMIEWVPASKGGLVIKVDAKAGMVETTAGRHRVAVANVIPPQTAGSIAITAGLADGSGFCPVNPNTFESKLARDVYVIGDSADAGDMPKFGYAAANQAKNAAAALVSGLRGEKAPPLSGICGYYSLLAPDYGISTIGIYRVENGRITAVKGAGGDSPGMAGYQIRKKEADFARSWYLSITQDVFA